MACRALSAPYSDSALNLRSVTPVNAASHGLRCHPPTCMLSKLRSLDDSCPAASTGYQLGRFFLRRGGATLCNPTSEPLIDFTLDPTYSTRAKGNGRGELSFGNPKINRRTRKTRSLLHGRKSENEVSHRLNSPLTSQPDNISMIAHQVMIITECETSSATSSFWVLMVLTMVLRAVFECF